jgi:hypothetical protein
VLNHGDQRCSTGRWLVVSSLERARVAIMDVEKMAAKVINPNGKNWKFQSMVFSKRVGVMVLGACFRLEFMVPRSRLGRLWKL